MAFTFEKINRSLLNPAGKRGPAGPLYLMWGTFTNTSGSTGGAMNLEVESIQSISFSSPSGALGVQATISGGTVTIVTTADYTGTWMAIVTDKK